jgi:spore germination protein YaaH
MTAKRWRLLALLLALAIPALGAALFRLQHRPAPAPVLDHRVIPVVIDVTPPPAPREPPVIALTVAAPAAEGAALDPAALDPAALAGGALAFSWRSAGGEHIYLLGAGAGAPRRATAERGDERDPAWSPDGRLLAFSAGRTQPDGGENWDIFVLEPASGALTRVSSDPALDRRPTWSPDGNWIAFETYALGNFDIFLASRDGRQLYQVTGDPAADLAPAWSPDGRAIAFASYRSGDKDIWLADLRDAADELAINLTNTPERDEDDPAWSPDGGLLAYSIVGPGPARVVLQPMTGLAVAGGAQTVAPGARPAWAPDGRSLLTVYRPEHDPGQTILLASAARGAPGSLAAFGGSVALDGPSWTQAALPASTLPARAPVAQAPGLRIAAWLGQGMTHGAFDSVAANADVLDVVSPYWYTLDARGRLIGYLTADDPAVVRFAHEHGLRLVPTIATQGDAGSARAVLRSPARRREHIRAIVARLEIFGYDGIDIDYEGLASDDRERFSEFIRELGAALHAEGLLLSVTVYPKVHDGRTWIGPDSNDYAELGRHADEVRIMAYEYHTASGPPGPVGPLYWQEAVLDYAVGRIPAEKIVLGLHLYGTDWGGGARALVYRDVALTLAGTRARPVWDERAGETTFSYRGRDGLHRVWYPDAQFVAARVALAERYGLAGLSFWRLGGEDEAIWETLRAIGTAGEGR